MTVPVCAIDSETDGVHPGRKPYEIALIRRDERGETVASFFVEIDLSTADPFGLRVGRFYDRHPLGQNIVMPGDVPAAYWPSYWIPSEARATGDYLTRDAAARAVARMTHGAHLIGAVPNFDTEIFDRLLREHGLCPGWHYHLVDVENLAVGYLAGQGNPIQPPWKSDDLSAALGLEPIDEDERHTALGDARFAMRIYDRIMGEKD